MKQVETGDTHTHPEARFSQSRRRAASRQSSRRRGSHGKCPEQMVGLLPQGYVSARSSRTTPSQVVKAVVTSAMQGLACKGRRPSSPGDDDSDVPLRESADSVAALNVDQFNLSSVAQPPQPGTLADLRRSGRAQCRSCSRSNSDSDDDDDNHNRLRGMGCLPNRTRRRSASEASRRVAQRRRRAFSEGHVATPNSVHFPLHHDQLLESLHRARMALQDHSISGEFSTPLSPPSSESAPSGPPPASVPSPNILLRSNCGSAASSPASGGSVLAAPGLRCTPGNVSNCEGARWPTRQRQAWDAASPLSGMSPGHNSQSSRTPLANSLRRSHRVRSQSEAPDGQRLNEAQVLLSAMFSHPSRHRLSSAPPPSLAEPSDASEGEVWGRRHRRVSTQPAVAALEPLNGRMPHFPDAALTAPDQGAAGRSRRPRSAAPQLTGNPEASACPVLSGRPKPSGRAVTQEPPAIRSQADRGALAITNQGGSARDSLDAEFCRILADALHGHTRLTVPHATEETKLPDSADAVPED